MVKMNPYLNFNGNAEEALNFYKSVLGGEFTAVMRYKEMPDGNKISQEDQDKIMHIGLKLGDDYHLMASDTIDSRGQKVTVGNNFYISLDVQSKEEADNLFKRLSQGGKIELPIQDTFWGSYFGMFKDKFGIQWMISYTK